MRSRWRDPRVWFGLFATALCGLAPALFVYLFVTHSLARAALLSLIALLTTSALYAAWRFAPWYPTRALDVARIAHLAQLKEGQTFYELGCGDGRVVIYLSEHSSARCIGVELSLLHFLVARLRQRMLRRENLRIVRADMFRVPLHDADVVYLYGLKQTMRRSHLEAILQRLKPGARLISYDYPLEGLTETTIDRATGGLPLYLYER